MSRLDPALPLQTPDLLSGGGVGRAGGRGACEWTSNPAARSIPTYVNRSGLVPAHICYGMYWVVHTWCIWCLCGWWFDHFLDAGEVYRRGAGRGGRAGGESALGAGGPRVGRRGPRRRVTSRRRAVAVAAPPCLRGARRLAAGGAYEAGARVDRGALSGRGARRRPGAADGLHLRGAPRDPLPQSRRRRVRVGPTPRTHCNGRARREDPTESPWVRESTTPAPPASAPRPLPIPAPQGPRGRGWRLRTVWWFTPGTAAHSSDHLPL